MYQNEKTPAAGGPRPGWKDNLDYFSHKTPRLSNEISDSSGPVVQQIPTRKKHPKYNVSILPLSSFKVREPEWLAEEIVEQDKIMVIFGDPESCKSFVSLDLGACIASGKKYHGHDVEQGEVVYIAGEGLQGMIRRLRAWQIRHQLDISESFHLSDAGGSFTDPDFANYIIGQINAAGIKPKMVVVDTLARNFGPGDENSTKDMNAFVAGLDKVRSAYNCTVLVIHHTGHHDKNRARGGMPLLGAADTEFKVSKDENIIRLESTKMKDFERPAPKAFSLCTVELGFTDKKGKKVTSAVLDSTEYKAPSKSTGNVFSGEVQKKAKAALDKLYEEHRQRLIDGGFNPDQARVSVSDWQAICKELGIDRKRFHEVKKKFVIEDGGYVKP